MKKQLYIIRPKYNKSLIEINSIERNIDKDVYYVKRITTWNHGDFKVWLDKNEYKNILNTNTINLSNYEVEYLSTYDACFIDYEVYKNKEQIFYGEIYEKIIKIIDKDFFLLEDNHSWKVNSLNYIIKNGFTIN